MKRGLPLNDHTVGYEEFRDLQMRSAPSGVPATIEALSKVKISPTSTMADDTIVLPESWMPAGHARLLSSRSFRIADCRPSGDRERGFPYQELALRQAIYALWNMPRLVGGSQGNLLAPTTFCRRAKTLIAMAQWSLENRPHDSLLFAHLSREDLTLLANLRANSRLVLRDLRYYGATKILRDVPIELQKTNRGIEADRRAPFVPPTPRTQHQPYMPFPDEFTSELGWRCMWIVQVLGPCILEAHAKCNTPSLLNASRPTIVQRRKNILKDFQWRDSSKEKIATIPFPLYLHRGRAADDDVAITWPKLTYPELDVLLTLLQGAHFVLLALSIGARWSEIAACTADGVLGPDDARLETQTFKLSGRIGGVTRDFPLSEVALQAMLQQSLLAKMFHNSEQGPLFVLRTNNKEGRKKGDPLGAMNALLQRLVVSLRIDGLLNGTSAHTHRFRKTLARLIALALIDAPKILYDLFGHDNLAMTISYMLSDKQVLAELLDVAERMAHAMTADALADLDGASGPAAPKLRDAMETLRIQSGKERFDTETITEAIEILDLVGVPFKIVRPGIMCTKQPTQFGACDPDRADPNPAACKPHCDHRLELAAAKPQVDRTIACLCEELGNEGLSALVRANLEGQLLHHLHRFADIRERWISGSPTAALVWSNRGNMKSG